MKCQNLLLLALAGSLSLVACNNGSSPSSTPTPVPTPTPTPAIAISNYEVESTKLYRCQESTVARTYTCYTGTSGTGKVSPISSIQLTNISYDSNPGSGIYIPATGQGQNGVTIMGTCNPPSMAASCPSLRIIGDDSKITPGTIAYVYAYTEATQVNPSIQEVLITINYVQDPGG
ncbi:hypothetical protein [Aquella oligotrophica]|uniref:Uncharacterized protein n=1 Tax=Aquella oligotrophica TaxID=2067065 RepID=A0A2I7N4H4_9NEIS|nr:hypothetical protein [Aquella oligotrophica]AUR51328.1 hypothetical protein CUN60_03110 [Aquella oligotrophica]